MLKAPPVKDRDVYHRLIYHEIKKLLDRILFDPILDIAKSPTFENAPSSLLLTALRTGRITYADSYFTGEFNAALGRELRSVGATWNKLRKAYYLPMDQASTNVKMAAAKGTSLIRDKIAKINERLDFLQTTGAIDPINFSGQFAGILIDIDRQFKTTMPADIGLPMTLTPFVKSALELEYTKNLNKYIQDMTRESTVRLREHIQDKISQGYRASDLVGVIQAQQGVSDRHAMFLAKQETSILVSTYRDSRYKEAGVKHYIWSTSKDSRVRHDHKILDGKVFAFNQPPVTDQATGARNNPGFDFGCRCVAIPVLDDDVEIKYGKK